METDKLKALHIAIVDAREGYEEAMEEAEDPKLQGVFQQMDELHRSAHADIHAALTAKGEKAEDDGSFMGTVHKTVISIRSAVTGLDDGSLSSFATGEEHIEKAYDEAIAEQSDHPSTAGMLNRHRDSLIAMIARMKAMSADS